jgi:hypothetical protein
LRWCARHARTLAPTPVDAGSARQLDAVVDPEVRIIRACPESPGTVDSIDRHNWRFAHGAGSVTLVIVAFVVYVLHATRITVVDKANRRLRTDGRHRCISAETPPARSTADMISAAVS